MACLAAALFCGVAFLWRRARVRGLGAWQAAALAALAVALGWVFARLFYFGARSGLLVPMHGWGAVVDLRPQGLALSGAVIGLLLAGWLGGRMLKQPAHRLLDLMAAPASLTLMLARLGEFPVSLGQGDYVAGALFQRFPFAVQNEWGEWYWAIFLLEALAALWMLAYALRATPRPDGAIWQGALVILCLTQILCESLRAEAIKWGFVRVQQLAAVLALAALLAVRLAAAGKRGQPAGILLLRALGFVACVGLLIGLEFALDRWREVPHWALYLAMAAVLAAMGALLHQNTAYFDGRRR